MDPNSGSGLSHSNSPEQGKFATNGNHQDSFSTGAPLPETYGDNRLVLLPRDPLWFFSYWEATADRLNALREQAGPDAWQQGQAVLRTYDVTHVDGNPTLARHFFDTPVVFDARQSYVNVPEPGRTHFVELGFRFPDGRFLALLESNRITLPRGTLSTETDSRWMIMNVPQWETIFESPENPLSRGSVEITKMTAQRWEFLRSVFSGASTGASSGALIKKEEPKS